MNTESCLRSSSRIRRSLLPTAWMAVAAVACIAATAAGQASRPISTFDSAGGRSTGGTVVNFGSVGGIGGIGTSTSFAAKQGYIAGIFDATAVSIPGSPLSVPETSSLPLQARLTLDDGWLLVPDPDRIMWSVPAGSAFLSVNPAGLATTGPVHQNEWVTVRASWLALSSDASVAVLDTQPDNFGSYAGDGIHDAWQFTYFGPDSVLASPAADPDGDGLTNLSEFITGSSPVDGAEQFWIAFDSDPTGNSVDLLLSRVMAGRTYTILATDDMAAGTWNTVRSIQGVEAPAGLNQLEAGDDRVALDVESLPPGHVRRFYKVLVSIP